MSIFNTFIFLQKKKSTKQRIPGYFFEILALTAFEFDEKNIGEAKYNKEVSINGRKISVTIIMPIY